MSTFHSYAIVPAAGISRRMERHKLLLAWKDSTVMEHVLSAWRNSRVSRVVVVTRGNDCELQEICRRVDVDLVIPDRDPPDMKVSVQHGLTHIERAYDPTDVDVWMLAPADMPRLSSLVIDRVLNAYETGSRGTGRSKIDNRTIIVPAVHGRRGHPVLFPWPSRGEVFALPADEGVNAVLRRHPTRELVLDADGILDDLDTPADYRRLRSAQDR
jgi:molybdenum cofactor cytidylyltransferase